MLTEKSKIKKYGRLDKARFPFIYLCILFPVCQFVVFFVFININSILLAFKNFDGAFSFENIIQVFRGVADNKDPNGFAIRTALGHSVILWLWSKIVIYPVAVVSTYVLFKRVRWHYFFRVVFSVPSVIGAVIWTTVLRNVSGGAGPIVTLFTNMGINLPNNVLVNGFLKDSGTAFPTLIVFTVVALVGGDVVLTGAFSRVPGEIFESARIDGAGFWRECFQIAIPCVGPTISTILTFALCSFFVADCNVYLYTQGAGGFNTETMGFYFLKLQYDLSLANPKRYNYPAAVGVSVSLISVPVVLLGRRLLDKIFQPVEF